MNPIHIRTVQEGIKRLLGEIDDMITGELRNQIDLIWDAFWSGGIANPLEVMEQITYLLSSSVWMTFITAKRRRLTT